jgi:hypothetical protein
MLWVAHSCSCPSLFHNHVSSPPFDQYMHVPSALLSTCACCKGRKRESASCASPSRLAFSPWAHPWPSPIVPACGTGAREQQSASHCTPLVKLFKWSTHPHNQQQHVARCHTPG